MKNKFIIVLTVATALLGSTPAFAQNYDEVDKPKQNETKQEERKASDTKEENSKNKPTAGFREDMNKINESYGKLTASQKQEIDKLMDINFKNDQEIIDKLIEFKVLDKQSGTTFKQHLKDKYNRKKSEGRIFGKCPTPESKEDSSKK